jgi:hypothetical protein
MMNTISAEIQRAFEEALATREILPPREGLIADGEWHRADTVEGRRVKVIGEPKIPEFFHRNPDA